MAVARPVSLLATSLVLLLFRGPLTARGHGMLVEPVNRGSMWRYGYNTPANYNDNEQFCGGQQVQWGQNGGRCGECGDDWALARPRPQENGGKFGTGQIVASYASGQELTATAQITANHMGGFLFRVCPLPAKGALETQECFDQHPLALADASAGGDPYYYALPSARTGPFSVRLRLPQGLTCPHCVLQWTYVTGNSWGLCPNGTGAVGCGPQEHFRTCSDISIL